MAYHIHADSFERQVNKIQQALMLKDETSYFDGIHGYLLAPIVEQ